MTDSPRTALDTEEWASHQGNIERHVTDLVVARNRGDMAAVELHAAAIEGSATAIRELAKRRIEAGR